MGDRDTLYSGQAGRPESFTFDERVANVFPDMIARSVPGYELVLGMIGLLADRHARAHTHIYDLGCSLGSVTAAMREAVQAEDVTFVAVDHSEPMVARCRERLASGGPAGASLRVELGDIRETPIANASVVVLNLTLQFVPPADRLTLLQRIAAGMVDGGALILVEKIRFDDPEEQRLQTLWHEAFKRARGYSELEIATKRTALENVLRPDTEAQHFDRMQAAGFGAPLCWFRCFSFAGYLAFR